MQYYFLLLAAERLFLGKVLARLPSPLRHAYSLFFILIGWVFFAHADLSKALIYLGTMFGVYGAPVAAGEVWELTRNVLPFVIMLIGCTPLPRRLFYRYVGGDAQALPLSRQITLTLGTLALLFLCTAYLADSSYNPFLYFRF